MHNIKVNIILPSKSSKSLSLILYSLHLPILLIILALSIVSFTGLRSLSVKNGNVLKDSSERSGSGGDDKDDEDDKDEDKDDDEDSNDDEDKNDDKDDENDEDKNEDENEIEDSDDDGIENEVDDDDDNDGIADLDEDKFENSLEKQETRQIIINADGTTSEVRREVEKDGAVKMEVRTFDAEGNKIMIEKYESGDGKEESRVKTYDATGAKLSDFELKTEDGKELELRVKEGDTELQRVKFNVGKNELIVRAGDESRVRIRTSQNDFVISREGINATSKFPISVDDATGNVFVKTPAGDVQLKAMPDTIVQKAQASDDLDTVEDVGLNTQTDKTTNLEYVVTGTKSEKLFGAFTLNIPSSLIYDAQTGGFVRNDQGFVTRILDLFSF